MQQRRVSFRRRKRWLMGTAIAVLLALTGLGVTAAVMARRMEPYLRARIIAALSDRFNARVELDSFHISLMRGIEAEGKGLRIWPPGQGTEEPAAGQPLIRMEEFRFHTPLRFRPGVPVAIRKVELKGLKVDLPAKHHFPMAAPVSFAGTAGAASGSAGWLKFVVDSIECTGAELVMETDKPGKLPLTFEIPELKLTEIKAQGAAKFEAKVAIPEPRGMVTSSGSFGPWQMSDPGESPLSGAYRLQDADLASFHGIAGRLESTGRYAGTLRDLTVEGEAQTPDFSLTHFGNAMPLHTSFRARVDGTNGDTKLEAVNAMLGRSHFTTEGQIVRVAPAAEEGGNSGKSAQAHGHDIELDVQVDKARIEDFLLLASKSATPLLTGDVKLTATLHIPPGPQPVHERIELKGQFQLDDARFTSAKIQDRIKELSLRGQGRPDELKRTDAGAVESDMAGSFTMAGGTISLPDLKYNVPGAEIDLKGSYGVEAGSLNFAGTAKMQATVSQMVGGWKGLLLKPADRFFKKDGVGTAVPIRIRGTREAPDFGIDFGRMKTTSPEKPGQR